MKADSIEIFDHDTDVDIAHKINTLELNNWISHLTYIETELANLIGVYREKLKGKLKTNSVLSRLLKKQTENKNLLVALNKYASVRFKIAECESMQCNMVYITEHESYRRSYLYHLDKYRKLKDEFFNKLQVKFSLLKSV